MIIIIIVIVIVLLAIVGMYNSLIQKKNAVDNAFHSIDVMLKKRYDLIPQLVATVKGYMNYEKDILLEITNLRTKVLSGNAHINEKVELDNQISAGLQQIMVSVEKYPDLKASQNFLKLQGAMNETEEQLAASRRFYNSAVNDYHNGIEKFPSSLVANWMKMKRKNYFETSEEEKSVPDTRIN